jgi:flagellar biosynthesis protein FlhF
MSVKRYFSTTSREAIKLVRAELGDEAVILSNRDVEGGVEVIASAPNDIEALIERSPRIRDQVRPPEAEADVSAMPTIARVAHAAQAKLSKAVGFGQRKRAAEKEALPAMADPIPEPFIQFVQRTEDKRATAPVAKPTAPLAAVAPRPAQQLAREPDARIINEILQMKTILQGQMDALSWRETASRRPLQARQISQMLSAGFTPLLSRAIAEKLPADFNESQASAWLQDTLVRNLAIAGEDDALVNRGGVYALVGPTGVGKTTTAAKLAARCAVKYGARSLGLITVDNYRIGGEDQLRAYGKILGVTVHTARDGQTLADLLSLMRDKHLVLIDSVGMGQRDSRLAGQMAMLNSPGIEPVLFLNASAQGETLDDVVRLYGNNGKRRASKVIISKIDEAVKYGFVLDCIIRHRLELQCVTNGQRVPEDLHPANAQYLVHRALKHGAAPAFALDSTEIPLILTAAPARNAGTDTSHV